jgi:WD40 repeat protein
MAGEGSVGVWDGRRAVRAAVLCAKAVIAVLLAVGTAGAAGAPEVFAQLGHTGKIHSIAFSANGRLLVSAGEDGGALLWDVPNHREFRSFARSASPLNAAAFSADGTLVATGAQDGTIVFWDEASGRQLKVLKGHSGAVTALAFAHSGKSLASASADRSVKIWETASGREMTLSVPRSHDDQPHFGRERPDFSPDLSARYQRQYSARCLRHNALLRT